MYSPRILEILQSPEHNAYLFFDYNENLEPGYFFENLEDGELHRVHSNEQITIDDVKYIQKYIDISFSGNYRKVIISSPSMTDQAQNALLKMVEESSPQVYFLINLSYLKEVLPTLLSRCIVIEDDGAEKKESVFFKTLKKSNFGERLKMIDNIWEQNEVGRYHSIKTLKEGVEISIRDELKKANPNKTKIMEYRKIIEQVDDAISTGGLNKNTIQTLAFI